VEAGSGRLDLAIRYQTLSDAFMKHPERFKNKAPTAGKVPTAVWINPPENKNLNDEEEVRAA
jgi:hypothetical protein